MATKLRNGEGDNFVENLVASERQHSRSDGTAAMANVVTGVVIVGGLMGAVAITVLGASGTTAA